MVETLRLLDKGEIHPTPQDHSKATLAPILKKEDGRMDFSRSASGLLNRMRGFRPWPGAFTTFKGKTLQVHRAAAMQSTIQSAAGIVSVEGQRLLVGCAQGTALDLIEVQIEGKRRMAAQEFINGYRPRSGDRLGE